MMPRKACFSRSWLTIALLAMSMLFGVAHAAQRELKEVRVAYPPSMASVTLMTGIKQKFFEEQGLTLTLLVIASDLALKSQVVGEIDYTLFGGGSGMVAAAQGLPIKVVFEVKGVHDIPASPPDPPAAAIGGPCSWMVLSMIP